MPAALVTGADRGLGLALCRELCQRGFTVFAGRYLPDWPELGILETEFPQLLHVFSLDVGSDASVAAIALLLEAYGAPLDFLICNAGISARGEPELFGPEENWEPTRNCFAINAVGPLRVTRACLPFMREGKKRLCYVSSEAGAVSVVHRIGPSGYCMSKAALNMAVRLLANELMPQGFTFRLFHPGWLKSYMSGTKNENAQVEPEDSAAAACEQFLRDREKEARLIVLDNAGVAWPF